LLRQANFIQALQIQPKLRRGAEEVRRAQGGVAGDAAASIETCLCQRLGRGIGKPSASALGQRG